MTSAVKKSAMNLFANFSSVTAGLVFVVASTTIAHAESPFGFGFKDKQKGIAISPIGAVSEEGTGIAGIVAGGKNAVSPLFGFARKNAAAGVVAMADEGVAASAVFGYTDTGSAIAPIAFSERGKTSGLISFGGRFAMGGFVASFNRGIGLFTVLDKATGNDADPNVTGKRYGIGLLGAVAMDPADRDKVHSLGGMAFRGSRYVGKKIVTTVKNRFK